MTSLSNKLQGSIGVEGAVATPDQLEAQVETLRVQWPQLSEERLRDAREELEGWVRAYTGSADATVDGILRIVGTYFSLVSGDTTSIRLVIEVAAKLQSRSAHRAAIMLMELPGSDTCAACDAGVVAELYRLRGRSVDALGDFAQAAEWCERAEALFAKAGDRRGVGRCMLDRATWLAERGDYDLALDQLTKAERAYRMAGHIDGVIHVLGTRATVLQSTGNPALALECIQEVLQISEVTSNKSAQARASASRASLLSVVGNPAEALRESDRALELAASLGDTLLMQTVLLNKASAHSDLGEHSRALEIYDDIEPKVADAGNLRLLCHINRCRGREFIRLERIEEGLNCLERSEVLAEKLSDKHQLVYIYSLRGSAYRVRKEYAASLPHFLRAAQLADATGMQEQRAGELMRAAHCLNHLMRNAEALEYAQEALQLFDSSECTRTLYYFHCLSEVVRAELGLGNYSSASFVAKDADELAKLLGCWENDDRRDIAEAVAVIRLALESDIASRSASSTPSESLRD